MDKLQKVLSQFKAPIRYAFAYGSNVFPQANSTPSNQIDLIFAVTHPQHWHSLNLRQHPSHYSMLRLGGSPIVDMIQRKGAGVYFNPYVTINDMTIKYGVVAVPTLLSDLEQWNTLYLAGRMHKPVLHLRNDARVQLAQVQNLKTAVRMALLMLPTEFSEEDLFMTLAGLSYQGDIRMGVAENPRKVYNIVQGQFSEFQSLYKHVIEDLPNVNYVSDGQLQQEEHLKVKVNSLNQLPKRILDRMKTMYLNKDPHATSSTDELLIGLVQSPLLPDITRQVVADIVRWPSIAQSAKGLLTAGWFKSVHYASDKVSKRWS